MEDKGYTTFGFMLVKLRRMKNLAVIMVCLITIVSCKDNKYNLPSGSPQDVLSQDLYSKLSEEYDSLACFVFGYAIVQKGKYGLIDYKGNLILECVYDSIISFNEDVKVIKRESKYGIINYNGTIVTKIEFESFRNETPFLGKKWKNNSLIALKREGYWGVYNSKGENILSFEYDDIANIEHGYTVISKDEKYGIVDSIGNILVDFKYDTIYYHYKNSDISIAELNGCIGIINSKNKIVTNCDYNCEFSLKQIGYLGIDSPQGGYIKMKKYQTDSKKAKLYGYVDCETGKEVIPIEYDDLGGYCEGLIWAKKDGKYGYININNNVVIPFEYMKAYDFSEGLAAVGCFKRYVNLGYGLEPYFEIGFINKEGKFIIPCIFNPQLFTEPLFKEGLAPIGISSTKYFGTNVGYINTNGDYVIKPIYEEAEPFVKGLAKVGLKDKYGFINSKGGVVVPIEYETAYLYEEDSVIIAEKENNGHSIEHKYNLKGEIIY